MALRVGEQVEVERVVQVGLTTSSVPSRRRRRVGRVAHLREQHAARPSGLIGHRLGREDGDRVARAGAEHQSRLVAGVELDLGAEVDARLAHQVLDVGELSCRPAAVGEDDEVEPALEQRVDAGVVEVPAVGEIPPRPPVPKNDAETSPTASAA